MKFRKRPVVIDAEQWFKNGDHSDDYTAPRDVLDDGYLQQIPGSVAKERGWEGEIVRYYRRPDDDENRLCQHCGIRMHEHGWIDTKEGGHIVCPGDWIVTGIANERYPVKPTIFDATYEPT